MAFKAFKPRKLEVLTENESVASVNSWQQNLEFQIASCDDFGQFMELEWGVKSVRNRGLSDDEEGTIPKRSAIQKCSILNHLIGLVVSYCPENIRLEIERKATSLKWIWSRVRRHYGFTKSEGSFLKLSGIKLEEGERYETFYQRIMSHLYDNLLTPDSGITFDGSPVTEDETMSPTTERLAVYLWLTSIDSRLPMYVSRVYAHDLMSKSLKDLQPQICQNLDSLLMELSAQEDIKVNYSRVKNNNRFRGFSSNRQPSRPSSSSQKSCAFCKVCKRSCLGHDINSCYHLSQFDRSEFAKALNVSVEDDMEPDTLNVQNLSIQDCPNEIEPQSSCSRVLCMKSPYFYCYFNTIPCKVVIDSGAESNIISLSFVQRANIKMVKACQTARQLDKSMIKTCGEVNIDLHHGNSVMKLSALVVESMDLIYSLVFPFVD